MTSEQERSCQMQADAGLTVVSMLVCLALGLIMGIKMGRRRSQ
jgi:hypothetical protein